MWIHLCSVCLTGALWLSLLDHLWRARLFFLFMLFQSFCLVAFSSFRFLLFPSFTCFQPCLAVGVPAVKLLRKLSVVIEASFCALTASPAPAAPAVAFKVCFLPHFELFRVIFFAFLFHAWHFFTCQPPTIFCSFTSTCFYYMQEICVTFHSFLPLKRLLEINSITCFYCFNLWCFHGCYKMHLLTLAWIVYC